MRGLCTAQNGHQLAHQYSTSTRPADAGAVDRQETRGRDGLSAQEGLQLSGRMALTGAAVFITGWIYAPYIYTIGAGLFALAQVNTPVKGKGKTLKRLRVQQIFGALALILTGAFMFTTRGNEWIACLTIAAILELYTAFRIPQEEEKERA